MNVKRVTTQQITNNVLFFQSKRFDISCNVRFSQLGKFYEAGAQSPYQEISNVYTVDYLEWLHMYDGISSARKMFNHLKMLQPKNKKLYMDMIEYEKLQQPINVSTVRKLFNMACSKFCRQGTGVGEYIFIILMI